MPATILSLSKARKAKARTGKEQQAVENRILFGRTREEKNLQKAQDKRARKALDGAQLPPAQSNEKPLTKK